MGFLDLERFARALRLRLSWYQWKQGERAWNKLEVPCDKVDQELFSASTIVSIGNGKKALFWSSSWINGTMAKTIAPQQYLKTKRKKLQYTGNEKWKVD